MRIYKCDIIRELESTRGNPESTSRNSEPISRNPEFSSRNPEFSSKNMEPLVGIRNARVKIRNHVGRI